MSLDVKKISILKTEIPAGIYPLTISDIKMHKKSNGELITYEENPAVIVSFENEGRIHQELYWIGSTNYTKLQKIILQVGLDPAMQISKKEIVGKQIEGIIKEHVTMRDAERIKSEFRLEDTFPIDHGTVLNSNNLVMYKQEGF